MGLEIRPLQVFPDSAQWPLYLEMANDYFAECWPSLVTDYETELKKRIEEGGRGLFLYFQNEEPVGLSNVYLQGNSLHIAEFYVIPSKRRTGIGKAIVHQIINWGKGHHAKKLVLEVDKELEGPNHFWSRFDFPCNSSGDRNIYSLKIPY